MKKIFQNIYLFSKLSTSLALFLVLIAMGYFFYKSYQSQDEELLVKISQESKFKEDIQKNSSQIIKIKDNLKKNQVLLSKIDKLLLDDSSKNENDIKSNNEFKIALKDIQKNIDILSQEINLIKTNINKIDDYKSVVDDDTKFIHQKSIKDLLNLILKKYENNLDFKDELTYLEKIIPSNKNIYIDKIRVVVRKPYKGQNLLENQFQQEMENYIKFKIQSNNNNFLYKIILPYVKIEPSQYNTIKNNDSLLLINISKLIKEKKISESLEKIKLLDEYEKFFFNTIEQSKIYIEFNKTLMELI